MKSLGSDGRPALETLRQIARGAGTLLEVAIAETIQAVEQH